MKTGSQTSWAHTGKCMPNCTCIMAKKEKMETSTSLEERRDRLWTGLTNGPESFDGDEDRNSCHRRAILDTLRAVEREALERALQTERGCEHCNYDELGEANIKALIGDTKS